MSGAVDAHIARALQGTRVSLKSLRRQVQDYESTISDLKSQIALLENDEREMVGFLERSETLADLGNNKSIDLAKLVEDSNV